MNDFQSRPPTAVLEQLPALTPRHCRAVLQYFHEHPAEAATVADLEAFIEERFPPDEGDHQVRLHLHHATLPELATHGLVDYDPRSNTARSSGHPSIDG